MTEGATQFGVSPAEVSDAATFVTSTAQALVSAVRSADAEVNGLRATWKGVAADKYSVGWEETRDGAMQVLDALADIAELLGVSAAAFTDIDAARAEAMVARASSLDLP